VSNRRTSVNARKLRAMVYTLLASRNQAAPLWSRKGLQRALAQLGYDVSLRSIARYVNVIRGKGVRQLS
jgi:hypothetical protein